MNTDIDLKPGSRVGVHISNLKRWNEEVAELVNGQTGTVERIDDQTGKVMVKFDQPTGQGRPGRMRLSGFMFDRSELTGANGNPPHVQ